MKYYTFIFTLLFFYLILFIAFIMLIITLEYRHKLIKKTLFVHV